jgi:hypothetical protein
MTDVTIWTGFAYETKGNVIHKNEEILTLDFWLSYNLTKEATLAARVLHKDGGPGDKGYNWLVFLNYKFDKNWSSAAFRVSGEKLKSGPGFTKLTLAPPTSRERQLLGPRRGVLLRLQQAHRRQRDVFFACSRSSSSEYGRRGSGRRASESRSS